MAQFYILESNHSVWFSGDSGITTQGSPSDKALEILMKIYEAEVIVNEPNYSAFFF